MDNMNQSPNDVKSGVDIDRNMSGNPPPYSEGDPQPHHGGQMPVVNQPQLTVIYPQGGMGVGGGMGAPGTMTAVAPAFVVLQQMIYQSTPYTCPTCNKQIVTKIKRKPTFKTHFFAAGFCLVCWLPCIAIPYCTNACNQVDHYCPDCDNFLGSYIP